MKVHEGKEYITRKEASQILRTTPKSAEYACEHLARGSVERIDLATRLEVHYLKSDVEKLAHSYQARKTTRLAQGFHSHEDQVAARVFEAFEQRLSFSEIVRTCCIAPKRIIALYQYWKRDLDDAPPQSDEDMRWERQMRTVEKKLALDEQRLKLLSRKASVVDAEKQLKELDK